MDNEMTLLYKVYHQTIYKGHTEKLVANSQDYVVCNFTFTNDWDNVAKYVLFSNDKVLDENNKIKIIEIEIIDNKCIVPYEVLSKCGKFQFNIKGVLDTKIITTTPINEILLDSGHDNGISPTAPTEGVLVKALNDIKEFDQALNDVADACVEEV